MLRNFVNVLFAAALLGVCLARLATAATTTIDFQDLSLGAGTVNNNSNGFSSRGASFNNSFFSGADFFFWNGWAYSKQTVLTAPIDPLLGWSPYQHSAYHVSSGGGDGSTQYGVAFSAFLDDATIVLPAGQEPVSMRVTNNTYAALSMLNGDNFAKKFGGDEGNDADFFLLKIIGEDSLNNPVGDPIEFYLADYRFEDNLQDYIVKNWTTIDLTSLRGLGVRRLAFEFESSDTGDFGVNTPTYFAMDNLIVGNLPEPSSLVLAAVGAFMLVRWRRSIRCG